MTYKVSKEVFKLTPQVYKISIDVLFSNYPGIKDITFSLSLLTRVYVISITWESEKTY